MSITAERKLNDSTETASHEVGHALLSLHHGANATKIHMVMADGCKDDSFPVSDKCVHGTNSAVKPNVSRMDIASIGYAGLIAMHLYGDATGYLDSDKVWEMVNASPNDWSKEDLEHTHYVPLDCRRDAFNRAYTFIDAHYTELREYAIYIAEDFAALDNDRVEYVLTTIAFTPPVRNLLPA